jgi:nicotinamidase-related amidase/uncharacterized membrane protein YcaP (DUF421 family)
MNPFFDLDWDELFRPSLSIGEAVLRGSALFLLILALFRVIPKRLIGRLALADLLVVTLVAGVARNGLIRDAYSLTDSLLVIATIIGWSYVLDWASYHSRFVHGLLHHDPVRLIKDGVVDDAKLKQELMTHEQLRYQLRAAVGSDAPADVAEAWMESNGRITAKLRSSAAGPGRDEGDAHRSGIPEKKPAAGNQALLLIDVINDLEFDEGEQLLQFAKPMAEKLSALTARARRAGVPVIYVNDNFGYWRSDFRATIDHCKSSQVRGRPIVERLLPERSDYFVLKPRHSGFYSTALETLLRDLDVDTVILTGMAGNICVLFTAYDAYIRGYRVVVPADGIASNTEEDTEIALAEMERALKAETPLAEEIAFASDSA